MALVARLGAGLADDLAVEHDEDAVGEGADLVELDGDEEDGGAGVAQLDEAAVDRLDRADVDAARRLPDEKDGWPSRHFARADELLLVPAREERAAQSPV